MQVFCPICHASLDVVLEHSGMTLVCPMCSGQFIAPAAPLSNPLDEQQQSIVLQPRRKPRFIVRKYPIYTAIMILCYVIASLIALEGLVLTGLVWSAWAHLLQSQKNESPFLGGIAFSFVVLIWHVIFAAIWVLLGETIRIILDIQANTQEAAFHSRYRD